MKKITFLFICLLAITFANAQLVSVAIVGDGAGGWPANTPGEVDAHQMTTTDNVHWTYSNLPVTVGSIKFRGNNSWALPYNWGGTSFPTGTAIVDGAGISSTPGLYNVTFNSTTLAYTFVLQTTTFPVISLIGPGVVGGSWDVETDMTTIDGIHYSLIGIPLSGELKFRQDHAWTPTTNWGGTFPSGTGIVDGPGIFVTPAGSYNVTFNRTTLAFSFYFPSVAIVGAATPAGWPTGSPGEIDPQTLTTADGVTYTLNSIVLTANNLKFRAENGWARQWGGSTTPAFPTGIGTQSGTDIAATAGTYSVTLNIATGAYHFGEPLATKGFEHGNFTVYPNPTQNNWNFNAVNERIESIQIIDIAGKVIITASPKNTSANIDASRLTAGIYFAKVATATSTKTIKLVKD